MSSRSFVLNPTPASPFVFVGDTPTTKVPVTHEPSPACSLTKELCHKSREGCTNGTGCPLGGGQTDATPFEKIVHLLSQLSPEHQRSVIDMIRGLAKLEGIEALDTESEPEPLDHYIPAWQNSLGDFTPRSRELYRFYVEHVLANVPSPITTIALEGYIAARREKVSPNALKNEIKAAKSFFGFLYERGITSFDLAAKISYPKIQRKEKRCPTPEEMAKFLAVLALAENTRAKMMMGFFINTGIRFTEMVTLNWGRVNLERPAITVLGKGNKVRQVPISSPLRDFLAELRNGHTDDELLFPTESKKGKWDNSDANKMIARLCQRAGIRRYTCHQFRHYFATYALKAGARVKVVQELLGHASSQITLDFYDHTDEEEIRKAHESFAPLLGEVLKAMEERKGGGNKHGQTD